MSPLAKAVGASVGGELTVIVGGERKTVRVCGIIELEGTAGCSCRI